MLFALICLDRPEAAAIRRANREAHIAYARQSGAVRLAGPFLNEAGDMVGSLILIEAADLDAARAWSQNDPYTQAQLFQSVEIRPWRATLGAIAEAP